MANPYEIEHGIKDKPRQHTRRPDMTTFFSQLSQITTDSSDPSWTHNNPNATPTPVEMAAAARLLQEQFQTLRQTASDQHNIEFLDSMIDTIEHEIDSPPAKVAGVPQSYLDTLDRVPKQRLKKTDTCPICSEPFLDDPYPLVVELPCHPTHRFDLDCVGPWLRLQGTCPLDRKDLLKKKDVPKPAPEDEDDEEDYDRIYA